MFVRVNKYFDGPVDVYNPFDIIRGMEDDKLEAVSKKRRNIRSHLFLVHGISTEEYVVDDTINMFSLLHKAGLVWAHLGNRSVQVDEDALWTKENTVLYMDIVNRRGRWKDPRSSLCVHFLKEATDAFLRSGKFEKIQSDDERESKSNSNSESESESESSVDENEDMYYSSDDYESSVDWRSCLAAVIQENIHRKHVPLQKNRRIKPESISSSSSSEFSYSDNEEESQEAIEEDCSDSSEFSSKHAELEKLAADKRKRKRIIIDDDEDE
jgi:hypothetical protein